jgi:exopolysaccharide production protein ExoZ
MNWFASKFELSRGGIQDNLRPMEGLRGFAVFMVFLVHFVTLAEPWLPSQSVSSRIAYDIHKIGNSGVDLFFVLSGYLIYGSLISREQNFWVYIRRRIERIYPVFLVVLIIYICLSFVVSSDNKIPSPFFYSGLIYIVNNVFLIPGMFSFEPIIAVSWSLSYEMFYYLAIPLIIWLTGMRNWSARVRILFFVLLLVLAMIVASGNHIRLILFISGIFLFETDKHRLMIPPPALVCLLLLIAGLALMPVKVPVSGGISMKASVLFVCFFLLCFSCFCDRDSFLAKAFSWTPIRWLGNMSYSYYLIHGLSLKIAFNLLAMLLIPAKYNSQAFFWTMLPVAFLITLLPATAFFLLIERPFSLVRKRKAGGAIA